MNPTSKPSRSRLIAILLVGSVLPVLIGKYLLPEFTWWLFGLSCGMVLAGTSLLMFRREETDAP